MNSGDMFDPNTPEPFGSVSEPLVQCRLCHEKVARMATAEQRWHLLAGSWYCPHCQERATCPGQGEFWLPDGRRT